MAVQPEKRKEIVFWHLGCGERGARAEGTQGTQRSRAATKRPRLSAGVGAPTPACQVSYRLKPLEAVGMAKPLRLAPHPRKAAIR